MKRVAVFILLGLALFCPALARDLPACPVAVYFSPHGGCTEAVVAEIDRAAQVIHVQAYSFTSRPIADALIRAHQRGIDVRVILDKGQRGDKGQGAFVAAAGVTVLFDPVHAIAHNKVMVIDGHRVITGSFNFTSAAEKSNAENLVVMDSVEAAAFYLENWTTHEEHSVP